MKYVYRSNALQRQRYNRLSLSPPAVRHKFVNFAQNQDMKTLYIAALCLLVSVGALAQKSRLTIEESVLGQFRQFAPENRSGLEFLPGSEKYVFVKDNNLMIGDVKGKETIWLTLEQFKAFTGGPAVEAMPRFTWTSENNAYFQHADTYFYHVDFKAKKITKGAMAIGDGEVSDYHAASTNYAYNLKNDLLISVKGNTHQITKNKEGVVSGQSISRNEYGIEKGTFWSTNGDYLAFYEKDESNVTFYPLTNYKTEPATIRNIRYPMAGDASEIVRVGVYDVANKKTVYLNIADSESDQYYATNLAWSPDNTLYIVWMNRQTTELRLIAYDIKTGKKRAELFTEKDDKWVEPVKPITFIPNQPNQFLWYSYRDGFHQWYKYDTSGKLLGKMNVTFEMTDFLGFDTKNEYFFAMGTGENPTEMHAYRVKLADMTAQKITSIPGVHHVSISGSGKFMLDTYSSITIPNKIDLTLIGGKNVANLLTAKDPLESKTIGTTEIFDIKAEDGTALWCRLIKPSHFDPKKKYPVVVYVYNGPHVQLVNNSYLGGASLWMHYLAEEGYLVFTVDGRGSMNRGKAFEQAIHRQLGSAEIADQLSGVNWLKKQPFVDPNRLGVHGWSFGGFMTTGLMLRTPNIFKVGVAGGPVIDWTLYEVMYTERYMDMPQENEEGYKTADLTQYVKNLNGKLLMIHGADDDVVVMQHNIKFLKTCIDNGKQVDFFVYPGHPHNVRGKDRVHLMTKVIDYFKANL